MMDIPKQSRRAEACRQETPMSLEDEADMIAKIQEEEMLALVMEKSVEETTLASQESKCLEDKMLKLAMLSSLNESKNESSACIPSGTPEPSCRDLESDYDEDEAIRLAIERSLQKDVGVNSDVDVKSDIEVKSRLSERYLNKLSLLDDSKLTATDSVVASPGRAKRKSWRNTSAANQVSDLQEEEHVSGDRMLSMDSVRRLQAEELNKFGSGSTLHDSGSLSHSYHSPGVTSGSPLAVYGRSLSDARENFSSLEEQEEEEIRLAIERSLKTPSQQTQQTPQAQAQPQPQPQPQSQPQPTSQLQPQPQPQSLSQPELQPQPQLQPEPEPEPQPQPQSQPQACLPPKERRGLARRGLRSRLSSREISAISNVQVQRAAVAKQLSVKDISLIEASLNGENPPDTCSVELQPTDLVGVEEGEEDDTNHMSFAFDDSGDDQGRPPSRSGSGQENKPRLSRVSGAMRLAAQKASFSDYSTEDAKVDTDADNDECFEGEAHSTTAAKLGSYSDSNDEAEADSWAHAGAHPHAGTGVSTYAGSSGPNHGLLQKRPDAEIDHSSSHHPSSHLVDGSAVVAANMANRPRRAGLRQRKGPFARTSGVESPVPTPAAAAGASEEIDAVCDHNNTHLHDTETTLQQQSSVTASQLGVETPVAGCVPGDRRTIGNLVPRDGGIAKERRTHRERMSAMTSRSPGTAASVSERACNDLESTVASSLSTFVQESSPSTTVPGTNAMAIPSPGDGIVSGNRLAESIDEADANLHSSSLHRPGIGSEGQPGDVAPVTGGVPGGRMTLGRRAARDSGISKERRAPRERMAAMACRSPGDAMTSRALGDGMAMGSPSVPGDEMTMSRPAIPGDGMTMVSPAVPSDGMSHPAPSDGMSRPAPGDGMSRPAPGDGTSRPAPGDGMTTMGVGIRPRASGMAKERRTASGGMRSTAAPGDGMTTSNRAPGDGMTMTNRAPGDGMAMGNRAPGDGMTMANRAPGDGMTMGSRAPGDGMTMGNRAPGDGMRTVGSRARGGGMAKERRRTTEGANTTSVASPSAVPVSDEGNLGTSTHTDNNRAAVASGSNSRTRMTSKGSVIRNEFGEGPGAYQTAGRALNAPPRPTPRPRPSQPTPPPPPPPTDNVDGGDENVDNEAEVLVTAQPVIEEAEVVVYAEVVKQEEDHWVQNETLGSGFAERSFATGLSADNVPSRQSNSGGSNKGFNSFLRSLNVKARASTNTTPSTPKQGKIDPSVNATFRHAMEKDLIGICVKMVRQGRNSDIYQAEGGPNSGGQHVAIKVFKTASRRLSCGQSDDNNNKEIKKLCRREYEYLKQAREAGLNVPKPFAQDGRVLFMKFYGTYNGECAPRLSDVDLRSKSKKWKPLFTQVLNFVKRLYNDAKLVHGDLSETSILVVATNENNKKKSSKMDDSEFELCFVDFSASVDYQHPFAMELLQGDLNRLRAFFSKQAGIRVPSTEQLVKFVVEGSNENASETFKV